MSPSTPSTIETRDEVFADLIRRHQAAIWRYLRYLGCDAARADDLMQETFVEVWRRPFVLRSEAETRSYLRLVARNVFLMALRKKLVESRFTSLEAAEAAWQHHARDDGAEFRDALRACLEALSDRARDALRLRYEEQKPRTAIADALAMTPDGVKTLMRRTHRVLRQCIERRLRT